MKSLFSFVFISLMVSACAHASTNRWTETQAASWSQTHTWAAGANYIPADAINTVEMWQASTFNPKQIDWELGQAKAIGFTTMRVFLNDLVWQDDPAGQAARMDTFLKIADSHHIKPIFAIFDSCWNAHPHLGVQPAPTPGVHNSGWVQSPGVDAVMNPAEVPRLQNYITQMIGHFANDQRILAWDLWNEPDNLNSGNDPGSKLNAVAALLPQVFAWARSANPTQPLTSGIWNGDWSSEQTLRPIEKLQIDLSDIVSFHNYEPADRFELKVKQLERYNRPIVCTEYMARPLGSTIQTIMPIAKAHNVSLTNWGFVTGKSQTYFPWDSWVHPYPAMPKVWFHDLITQDGTPYDIDEIKTIQSLVGKSVGKSVVQPAAQLKARTSAQPLNEKVRLQK